MIDGERALFDGRSEVATSMRRVVGVEGGKCGERREEFGRIDARF